MRKPCGVDAGHRAPVGLDAALAGHPRDFVAQRREQRIEEFRAESRDRNRSAPKSATSIPKTCSWRADRRAADWRAPSRSPAGSRRRWRARRCSPARCGKATWSAIWQARAADWADTLCWSRLWLVGGIFRRQLRRSFPRRRESSSGMQTDWVPAFAGTSGAITNRRYSCRARKPGMARIGLDCALRMAASASASSAPG